MAGEFRLTSSLSYEHDNDYFVRTDTQSIDQTATDPSGGGPGVVSVSTTYGAITLTGITNNGIAIFKNLDTTNFVEIGIDQGAVFYPFLRLNPGEQYTVRLSHSVALYARADTAAVRLEAYVWEA